MKTKVGPAVIAVIVILVLAVIGYFGYKTVGAPAPSVSGIGKDGQPMSQQQVDELANKMSGGRHKPNAPSP